MEDESTWSYILRKTISVLILLGGIAILMFLFLSEGRADLATKYVILYGGAGVLGIVLGVMTFIADFVRDNDEDNTIAKIFYLVDRSSIRPLSYFPLVGVGVWIVFSVGIAVLVSSTDASIFSSPNPYASSLVWTEESLAGVSTPLAIFHGAVVPGFVEELAIFILIQVMTAVLLIVFGVFVFRQDLDELFSPAAYWAAFVPSWITMSAAFSWLHARYGANEAAKIWAFVFELVMQLFNQLTGMFGSWGPHIAHNAFVILNKAFSIVLVG